MKTYEGKVRQSDMSYLKVYTVKMTWDEFMSYYEEKEPLYIDDDVFVFTRMDFETLKKYGFLSWKNINGVKLNIYIKDKLKK